MKVIHYHFTRIQKRLIVSAFLLIYIFVSSTRHLPSTTTTTLSIEFPLVSSVPVFAFSPTNIHKFSNPYIGADTCTSSSCKYYMIHRSLSQSIPIWKKLYHCVPFTKANVRVSSTQRNQHNMFSSSSSSSNAGTISSTIDDNNNKLPHQQQQSQRPEFVLSVKEYLYHHAQTITGDDDRSTGSNNDDESLQVQQINSKLIQFILASQSPRRKEILDMMGLHNRYSIIPSPLNETFVQNLLKNNYNNDRSINPIDYVRTLAEQKAYAVAYDMNSNFNTPCTTLLILGSDTIVVLTTKKDTDDDTSTVVLEKPKDQNDAMQMLQSLQGRSHQVYTGVAIVQVTINKTKDENDTSTTTNNYSDSCTNGVLYQDGIDINTTRAIRLVQSFVECSTVYMSQINNNDIESYITKTNEPYDKAGAYGIQGIGGQYITKIDGDFFNVMGLPMHQTSRALTSAILDIVDNSN